jgi:arginyl-tRNA--protein-N-Asp/Glu arginylyltransferase
MAGRSRSVVVELKTVNVDHAEYLQKVSMLSCAMVMELTMAVEIARHLYIPSFKRGGKIKKTSNCESMRSSIRIIDKFVR